MGVLASSPWIGLSLLGMVYLSSIPLSLFAHRRQVLRDRESSQRDVVTLRAVESGSSPRD